MHLFKRNSVKCGSELARDSGVSGSSDVECAAVIASKLAPTGGSPAFRESGQAWELCRWFMLAPNAWRMSARSWTLSANGSKDR
ncbi:hypothetical protein F7R20_26015 [Pseudomonas brassicacearum subsp. brassicacearum]|nr:hypothetical protein F7R20_26015 [Pseudomonas brassicacearum subsp. brassicacearum]PJH86397.1 hypothetical protein CVG87_25385 [Pseudomonas sp. WCS365]QEO79332.1 hypothetical protein ELZ14_17865 [Pseudomonas brassicacearum]